MFEFLRRNQVLLSSGLFLAFSLVLVTANRSGIRRFDPVGVVFLEVLRPLQAVTTRFAGQLDGIWIRYVGLIDTEADNQRLRERLRELEAEHSHDVEIELENQRLARLLDYRTDLPSQVVTARVIGKDATGLFQSLTLDRGQHDGVRPGMAVVCPDGVVGRIAQSSPHASRVLLLSDHNSGVDALVSRTRARGIVEGTLSGNCSMKYIKRSDEIDVNDAVVTSGLDGMFPKGIRIGRVSGVTRKDVGLYQVAEVTPAVDFAKLEEVMVLLSPPQEVNEAIDAAARARETPEPTPMPTAATPSPRPTTTPGAPAARKATAPARSASPPPRGAAHP